VTISPATADCADGKRDLRALVFLGQLAAMYSGYEVRGVKGWAHAHELRELAGCLDWEPVLARLASRGLAIAHDASVRVPPARALVYRVTPAGLAYAAREMKEAAPWIPEPGPDAGCEGVYCTAGGRRALELLRDAIETDGTSPGWLACGEMERMWRSRSDMPLDRSFRPFSSRDLALLVEAGLAEMRRVPAPGGKRRPPNDEIRVTPAGRTAPLLCWHGRTPDDERFHLLEPGWVFRSPYLGNVMGSGH